MTYLRDGHAARIDPATREEAGRVNTGPNVCGVAIAGDALWIADTGTNSVARFSLDDGRFIDRLDLDGPPWDLQTLDGERVWLSPGAAARCWRSTPPPPRRCSPSTSGRAPPASA